VCEKPDAARRIAQALDDDNAPDGYSERGVPYYIARRGEEDLIIVSALGHLFTVAQNGGGWTYPVFGMRWVPAYEADKKLARTKGFIEVITKLALGVDSYVNACDYDMEGSLIGYMVLLKTCGEGSLDRARRMRYSTLTDVDLKKSWEEMSNALDFPLIEAGRARHEVDWLFGINLSRALTISVKNVTGFYKTLSIGRVQGPTLSFISDREVEIGSFVPIPFWTVNAEARIDGKKFILEHERPRINVRKEAEKVESDCRGKKGVVKSIQSARKEDWPFPPFNLGDLQREAYYKLRLSPSMTLRAAERLYIEALISYPRTSSQRLPPSIDFKEILEGLQRRREYSELATILLAKTLLKPMQGEKDDPAHPAIHPTGRLPDSLGRTDSRVFDLICRRFMASFDRPTIKVNIDAIVDIGGQIFHLKGSRILEKGWMMFYEPYIKEKETELLSLKEGQMIPITSVNLSERCTRPPPRFNQASLLKLMEDEMIGTKATRADIIDTLFRRGYVNGGDIEMTDLGFAIVETMSRYSPQILSLEMTRNLERELDSIQSGEVTANTVVEGAKDLLGPVLSDFKEKERLIGAEIDEALRREAQKASFLGPCPACKNGEIRIVRNNETGKRFAGCSNFYADLCTVSYPLPQRGKIQPTGRRCMSCNTPIVRVIRRGRRPWDLCLNPRCPTKGKNGDDGRQV